MSFKLFFWITLAVIVPPSNELFDIQSYSLEDFFNEFEMNRVMPGLQHGKLVPRNTGGALWKVWTGDQTHYILGVPSLSLDFCKSKEFLEIISTTIGPVSYVYSEGAESSCQSLVAQHFTKAEKRSLSPSDRKSILHKFHQDTIRIVYKRDSSESFQFMKATHQRRVIFQKFQTELYKLGDLFGVTVHKWCAFWAEYGRRDALQLYKELFLQRNKLWVQEIVEANLQQPALIIIDWDGILGFGGIVESFRRANFSPKQIPIEGFWDHGEDVELLRLSGIDHARLMEKIWLIRVGRYGDEISEKHDKAKVDIEKKRNDHIAKSEKETKVREGVCTADSDTCDAGTSDKEEL